MNAILLDLNIALLLHEDRVRLTLREPVPAVRPTAPLRSHATPAEIEITIRRGLGKQDRSHCGCGRVTAQGEARCRVCQDAGRSVRGHLPHYVSGQRRFKELS